MNLSLFIKALIAFLTVYLFAMCQPIWAMSCTALLDYSSISVDSTIMTAQVDPFAPTNHGNVNDFTSDTNILSTSFIHFWLQQSLIPNPNSPVIRGIREGAKAHPEPYSQTLNFNIGSEAAKSDSLLMLLRAPLVNQDFLQKLRLLDGDKVAQKVIDVLNSDPALRVEIFHLWYSDYYDEKLLMKIRQGSDSKLDWDEWSRLNYNGLSFRLNGNIISLALSRLLHDTNNNLEARMNNLELMSDVFQLDMVTHQRTFRFDTRSPNEIQSAKGFFPNPDKPEVTLIEHANADGNGGGSFVSLSRRAANFKILDSPYFNTNMQKVELTELPVKLQRQIVNSVFPHVEVEKLIISFIYEYEIGPIKGVDIDKRFGPETSEYETVVTHVPQSTIIKVRRVYRVTTQDMYSMEPGKYVKGSWLQ